MDGFSEISGFYLTVAWFPQFFEISIRGHQSNWPRGLMDKASDFESEDCEFESRRGRNISFPIIIS